MGTRYGLWLQASCSSTYTPSRLKTKSGTLLSAHYAAFCDRDGLLRALLAPKNHGLQQNPGRT